MKNCKIVDHSYIENYNVIDIKLPNTNNFTNDKLIIISSDGIEQMVNIKILKIIPILNDYLIKTDNNNKIYINNINCNILQHIFNSLNIDYIDTNDNLTDQSIINELYIKELSIDDLMNIIIFSHKLEIIDLFNYCKQMLKTIINLPKDIFLERYN